MTLNSDKRMIEYYRKQLTAFEKRVARAEAGKPPKNVPSVEAAGSRMRTWRHNSFLGHCVMAEKNLVTMRDAPSTTTNTKQQANEIIGLLYHLRESLKERID